LIQTVFDNHNKQESKSMQKILFTAALAMGLSTQVLASQELATSKSCMACHAIDHKVVGPAYQDVAKKYAGDAGAQARLATKILKGGGGVWGPIPMPANSQVSEAEASQLAAWVLSLKN
jgi:cytochrome c